MSEYGSRYKRRRSEFVFGVILVTIMLPLLVLIERSLGLETRWLAGANCVITSSFSSLSCVDGPTIEKKTNDQRTEELICDVNRLGVESISI